MVPGFVSRRCGCCVGTGTALKRFRSAITEEEKKSIADYQETGFVTSKNVRTSFDTPALCWDRIKLLSVSLFLLLLLFLLLFLVMSCVVFQRFRKNVPRNMRPLVEGEDDNQATPESRRCVLGVLQCPD